MRVGWGGMGGVRVAGWRRGGKWCGWSGDIGVGLAWGL